jgi:hypothetical protein
VAAERRRATDLEAAPELVLDGAHTVGLAPLAPGLAASLAHFLRSGGDPQSLFRIAVASPAAAGADAPCIAGRYHLAPAGFWFAPHFPFEPGLRYQAAFDPRALNAAYRRAMVTGTFSLPVADHAPTLVRRIFPSDAVLPENLLRFYVVFTSPMRRGHAEGAISITGPDGRPATDALYRAPLELWDRSMRRLTVLLDPGRLKRGVGPNRALGPPLQVGFEYELAIGTGMLDIHGRPLARAMRKRFRVADAVRQPVAAAAWRIAPPHAGTRGVLTLDFPAPLDRAILAGSIAVRRSGETVPGRVTIAAREHSWRFIPARDWMAGEYELHVATTLEDPCGNTLRAPFDRPLRHECPHDGDPVAHVIPVRIT